MSKARRRLAAEHSVRSMQSSTLPAKSWSVKRLPTSTKPSAEASNDWDPNCMDCVGGSATPREDLSLSEKKIAQRRPEREEEDAIPGHARPFSRERAARETTSSIMKGCAMELQTEILVVGETAQSSLELTEWLERRGCRCHFASSCKEACRLVSRFEFDLVLSHFELPDRTAYPLLEKLIGSTTTLFYSTRIENGCLWLPALAKGRKWPGAKVLRPNEFAITLGTVLKEASSFSSQAPPGIPPIATETTRFANLKSLG